MTRLRLIAGCVVALLSGGVAFAQNCPNLSGQFGVISFTDPNGTRPVDPTQVKIEVSQSDCAALRITQNLIEDPGVQTVTNIRTDGVPTLYIARPEDSDGPEEYLSCTFVGRKLVGRILYLYEGNSQYVDTGATLSFDLDETGALRELLLSSDAHGGIRVVDEFKTRRIMDVPVRTVYSRGTHEQISDRPVDPFS